jgi:ABC-type nitrate/sulfonate/bicarbonate transport system substrate-binding protein
MRVRSLKGLSIGLAILALSASSASAADALKIAVGQCGNWDSSPVQLGDGAGIYAKHGILIEAVCTQGTGETQQAVISGSADIGIGIGTLGALGAYSKGAPIRIISGSATGNADFWFVKGDSPLKTIKDATDSTTIAYSTNGASTHSVVLGLIRELGLKGKPVATGGPAATLTVALSGQVDIGWTSPPLGFDMLDDGRIRIFVRANDVPSLKDQTIRVNIANANSLKARRDVFVRFMKAFGETIDWMYSSDPKALEAYVAFRKTTPRNATRLRDEFFAKSALDPNTVKGMDALMTEAVNLKFMPRVLTTTELAEFVQVPLR